MGLPKSLQTRISRLKQRLADLGAEGDPEDNGMEDEEEEEDDPQKKKLLAILRDACTLVRNEAEKNSPHLIALTKAVQKILRDGVEYAYGDSDMFDFMDSWAHDNDGDRPLIEDVNETKLPFPAGAIPGLLKLLQRVGGNRNTDDLKLIPDPWKKTAKPHPKTSPLVRFRPGPPSTTPTSSDRVAKSIYDGRCEVQSIPISPPIRLQFSQESVCLALTAMGGWKNRSPALHYYLPSDSSSSTKSPRQGFIQPGLADIAYHMAVDDSRNLIFIGDSDRVKSYSWISPGGAVKKEPHPMHTLDTDRAQGPITVLPNGTIVRAGKGFAAVWEIDGLQTHGVSGSDIIGEGADEDETCENTMRDDPEEIEGSSGSPATSRIKFSDQPNLSTTFWRPLVQTPSIMLCVTESYDCVSIDLEQEGKTTAYYLGHGGKVNDISVNSGDPHMFLTAASDGFARLFDTRTPLPVLTFDACQQNEPCDAAVLAYPDGIPTVFTGTGRAEQIKLWDVRARAPVYELATGNNLVQSLAWDSKRNHLYAATECTYLDRMGYHHEYRAAKIPREGSDNEEMQEDDDSDVDEEYDDGPAWPKNAWHNENYFGYTFDAGDHRIYRYAFKEDPDISTLPEYGDAHVGSNQSYW